MTASQHPKPLIWIGRTRKDVYTVKIGDVVYALHAFQKKLVRGIATPKTEIALIKQRLKEAYLHYEQETGDGK